MRYRVAFAKRVQSGGDASAMRPSAELDLNLSDGIVAEKEFVEQLESDAQHSQEVLDEDDAFLGSAAAEVWEYEVVDARATEFEEALQSSDLVLEFDIVDYTVTTADEAFENERGENSVYPMDGGPDGGDDTLDVTAAGSGARSGDDGPAGMPTVDPSAGGLSGAASTAPVDTEEMVKGDSGGIDDLNVTEASDRSLGLTDLGKRPPNDWAADTGPSRTADRGIESEGLLDDASTLSPPKRRRRR